MKIIPAVVISLVFLLNTGCTIRMTDFTAISTKNLHLPAEKGNRVTGEDCANLLFGLIPLTGTFQPNLKEAIDQAIEAGNGDVLIDGVLYNSIVFIPLLFTQVCYTVEGTIGTTQQ
jgi:hypothetical protein